MVILEGRAVSPVLKTSTEDFPMTIIKNSLFAALAAVTMSAAGVTMSGTSAEAGYHYAGGYNIPQYGGYKVIKCRWGWIWKKTHRYHGHKHKIWAKIC